MALTVDTLGKGVCCKSRTTWGGTLMHSHSTHSFLFVLHSLHLLLSLSPSNGQAEGCYIPDDCHHHHLMSVRPPLTSQQGSEPNSRAAETNANCPVRLVYIQLSSGIFKLLKCHPQKKVRFFRDRIKYLHE